MAVAAVAAQQRGGSHQAAQAHLLGVSGGFAGAARLACSASCRLRCYVKKVVSVAVYFSRCAYVCACPVRISDAPNYPLHEGMRGVA